MAWMQTLSGKAFDLFYPDPKLVDFENDVSSHLAKISRFSGATKGDVGYSVAQHCVVGAESIYEATGSTRLAAIFLLHDAHEAFCGDIATPTAKTLAEIANDMGEYGSTIVSDAIKELKGRIDGAVFAAAGVDLPDETESAAIKHHDVAMMNAERAALKRQVPRSWGSAIDAVPAANVDPEDLDPWDGECARLEWLRAFERFVGTAL